MSATSLSLSQLPIDRFDLCVGPLDLNLEIKMNQFSSKQKQREKLLSQFISFTQANEKNAINFLSQHDWKLDLAVDAYYLSADSGGSRKESSKSSSAVDRKKLDQIWSLYKGMTDWFFMVLDGS